MMQSIARKTGLPAAVIQSIVPVLLPLVCQIFNLGAVLPGTPGQSGKNQVLDAFLKDDRDNRADLGEVFKFAGRFLNVASGLD
jgi:hypothetical protein